MAEQISIDVTEFEKQLQKLADVSIGACEIRDSVVTDMVQVTLAWSGCGANTFAEKMDCVQARLYDICRGLEELAQFVQMAKEAVETADQAGTS